MRLANRIAIVTGAAQGIGLGCRCTVWAGPRIANACAFLASNEASYVKGAVIEVSGGVTV